MKKIASIFVILLSLFSCIKNDQNQNDTFDSKVKGNIILPSNAIDPTSLTVLSSTEESTINNSAAFMMDSSSFKDYSTQVVLNSVGEAVMMRYNYPNSPDHDISIESTALAMLMNTPAVQSLTEQGRINLITYIVNTPEFVNLLIELELNLSCCKDGRSFTDTTNTDLINAFKSLGAAASANNLKSAFDEPILTNQSGNQVVFINNGVAVNYWVGIYNNGQKMISAPIDAAQIFSSSIKDIEAGFLNSNPGPASIDYTFKSNGIYKVYIRSGRILDNTFESKAALVQNLTLGALDLLNIVLPDSKECTKSAATAIQTYIETNLNLYTISVSSPSDLQTVIGIIFKATKDIIDLKSCSGNKTKKLLGFFTKYFDLIGKVGNSLNSSMFVFHFLSANPAIDKVYTVTDDIVSTFDSIPTLTTNSATSIKNFTASSGGNITKDGGHSIIARGVCWSTLSNPSIENSVNINISSDGTGTGSFTSYLTGLRENVQYFVRAYATNSVGTGYGNEVTFFTTNFDVPSVFTTSVSTIMTNTAVSGGNAASDGGSQVTSRGVCWSTAPNPTISDDHTSDGSGIGSYISNLTGLKDSTQYYVRAYATNSEGTGYGNEVNFKTKYFYIGESYGGGIISWIDNTGKHGFIATPSDLSNGISWYPDGAIYFIPVSESAIGFGKQNTIDIVNKAGQGNYAAKLCDDLILNGKSDWYLPSSYELLMLYTYRNYIGGFGTGKYWSSTFWEMDLLGNIPVSASALVRDFNSNGLTTDDNTNNKYSVRAIRYF
jgi:hypothetical protein